LGLSAVERGRVELVVDHDDRFTQQRAHWRHPGGTVFVAADVHLYVTGAGMPRAEAADLVRQMAGRHRLPDALRRADILARHGPPEPPRFRGNAL
jgi:endonuclease V-like protein UPF0215 family